MFSRKQEPNIIDESPKDFGSIINNSQSIFGSDSVRRSLQRPSTSNSTNVSNFNKNIILEERPMSFHETRTYFNERAINWKIQLYILNFIFQK